MSGHWFAESFLELPGSAVQLPTGLKKTGVTAGL
jgi:hypothetical protein